MRKLSMTKYSFLLIVVALFAATSCRTVKKTQTQTPVLDTEKVTVTDAAGKENQFVLSAHEQLLKDKIDFSTFSSKLSIDIQSPKLSQSVNGTLRMQKDKVIWISVTGPFSIEVFRAMITPDSVMLLDKLQNKIVRRNISYLQNVVQLPLDFYDLQDLLMGNAVMAEGTVESYKITDNALQLMIKSALLNNMITLNRNQGNNNTIAAMKFVENNSKRSSDIGYTDYKLLNGEQFSHGRNIVVNDGSAITTVAIEYREPVFNNPVTFPFSVSRNFSEG